MGKSSKKASTKVEVAPAAAGTKPIKNGKREAEAVIEKQVHVKKQKQNEEALKQAIAKKKTEAKTPKKAETSSDDDSSESEEEVEVKPAAKQVVKKPVESISEVESSSDEETAVESPAKTGKPDPKGKVASSSSDEPDNDSEDDDEPKSNVPVKNVTAAAVAAEKKDETSDESDSDDDMPSKVASQEKKVSANGIGSVPVTKKEEASESSESEDESDEEDETPAKVASKAAPTNVTAVSSKGKDDTSDSESDDDDEPDSDEKPKVAKAKKDGGSEEDDSEEETSESEEEDKKASKTPKKKGGDVEMVDADDSAKSNIEKAPQTPSTTQVEATGSKTLFMGNLSFSVEKTDVENFFKDAGEIADVRFATDREGVFKGFGHIEFATVEAAENALKSNGHELLGRQIKLDLARERGAYTPATGNENSYQKGGKAQTIFVRGFDTSGGEDQVRSALEEHFGSCGDISRVSIPKDYGGGLKGIAYLDFTDGDTLNKALKLDGSELGEATLTVEAAKPRDNSFGSGRGRGRSDGGGRFSGGRGRFGGGRSGGRFGGGGRRGGGRGGRGRK